MKEKIELFDQPLRMVAMALIQLKNQNWREVAPELTQERIIKIACAQVNLAVRELTKFKIEMGVL